MKFDQLTKEVLNDVFNLYRSINKAHWRTPELDQVKEEIKQHNQFEFSGSKTKNWSSKLKILKDKYGIRFEFLYNPDIEFKQKLIEMKKEFELKYEAYINLKKLV